MFLKHKGFDKHAVTKSASFHRLQYVVYLSVHGYVLVHLGIAAVEDDRAPHSVFIGFVLEVKSGVLYALCGVCCKIEDACDRFDDDTCDALGCSSEESQYSVFFGFFKWLQKYSKIMLEITPSFPP